eukprot:TRINITY_DN713_c0_g1_i1.p1 TRINITY_DN713_c0_g1~~TRINITY_DN713_c0_g1_i1.p1  ORF type:complete len:1450 (+),score=393.86 TRINITY_DN713_c0_g1_i1:95-4351(+)
MTSAVRPGGSVFEEVVDAVRQRRSVRVSMLACPASGVLSERCMQAISAACGEGEDGIRELIGGREGAEHFDTFVDFQGHTCVRLRGRGSDTGGLTPSGSDSSGEEAAAAQGAGVARRGPPAAGDDADWHARALCEVYQFVEGLGQRFMSYLGSVARRSLSPTCLSFIKRKWGAGGQKTGLSQFIRGQPEYFSVETSRKGHPVVSAVPGARLPDCPGAEERAAHPTPAPPPRVPRPPAADRPQRGAPFDRARFGEAPAAGAAHGGPPTAHGDADCFAEVLREVCSAVEAQGAVEQGTLVNPTGGLLSARSRNYIRRRWGTVIKTGVAAFLADPACAGLFTIAIRSNGAHYVSLAPGAHAHAPSGASLPRDVHMPAGRGGYMPRDAPTPPWRAHAQQPAAAAPRARDSYRRRQPKRRSWPQPSSHGDKPPVAKLVFKHRLPPHDMPPELHGTAPSEQEAWLRDRAGAPAGPMEPTSGNFVDLFSGLLFLEELQMKKDIKTYDMEDVVMEAHEDRPDLLKIRVPGLAEKRPSVLRGDHIKIMTGAGTVHQGYVFFVDLDSVSVHFAPEMRPSAGTVGHLFHVRFSYNRTPLRKQHEALRLCSALPVLDLLAPPGPQRARARNSIRYHVINEVGDARAVVDQFLAPAAKLFVDCEGESLSRRGALHLLQIGDGNQIFLFDAQTLAPDGMRHSGLAQLLEAEHPKKVMWDCREDADALLAQFGIRLSGVLDLQVLDVMRDVDRAPHRAGPLRIRGLKSLAGSADDSACSGADISQMIARRPLPRLVLEYSARDIDCIMAAADKLGLADLPRATLAELEQASARYCDALRTLRLRRYDFYEKGRAPWAGPYLPEGILHCYPDAAPCLRCRRSVSDTMGELCRVCAAIESARPPPAEHAGLADRVPHRRSNWRQPAELNRRQRAAVEQIGGMQPGQLRIVFGPPGTGKTVTLVSAIQRVLDHPGARVLCACPSNTAADVVAERLSTLFGPDEMYRMYALCHDPKDCPAPLVPHTSPNDKGYTIHDTSKLRSFRIIIATCSASFYLYSLGLPRSHFSHIFVDEAGQGTEPDCIVPISVSPHAAIVLLGDPQQLGPVVRSALAMQCGLGRSMLERLIADPRHRSAITKLTETYRAHEAITKLYSDTFYDAELVPRAPADVAGRFLRWRDLPNRRVPLLFHHVEGVEARDADSPSWYNKEEIGAVKQVLESLLQDGSGVQVRGEDIGVITPYLKQKRKLEKHFHYCQKFRGVCVRTVEGFQGQERPVIIVTTVRSRPENVLHDRKFQLGFVEHARRTNVAISRAQGLLVVVGNMKLLSVDPNWGMIIQRALELGSVRGLPLDIKLETGRVGAIVAPVTLRTSDGDPVRHGHAPVRVGAQSMVQIIGSNASGFRIRTPGGAVGFVPADAVSFSDSAAAEENVDAPWRDW